LRSRDRTGTRSTTAADAEACQPSRATTAGGDCRGAARGAAVLCCEHLTAPAAVLCCEHLTAPVPPRPRPRPAERRRCCCRRPSPQPLHPPPCCPPSPRAAPYCRRRWRTRAVQVLPGNGNSVRVSRAPTRVRCNKCGCACARGAACGTRPLTLPPAPTCAGTRELGLRASAAGAPLNMPTGGIYARRCSMTRLSRRLALPPPPPRALSCARARLQ
jgi:hypothetical protein